MTRACPEDAPPAPTGGASLLPLRWPWELEPVPEGRRWLVEQLWLDQGVGIIGGEPKCCKSFMALDLAVSVASGSPCLRSFRVPERGHVLYFAAEDALHIVRSRLEGICEAAETDLHKLSLQLITSPSLRLDLPEDTETLDRTIAELKPKLLILDPFVRLHRIDENNSGEVAPILANLRLMQRAYGVAIIVVHHAKKGASGSRAGQALRGSSEFHAWGDCNLYLRRDAREELTLGVEHRAEASRSGIPLRLQAESSRLALQLDPNRDSGSRDPAIPSDGESLIQKIPPHPAELKILTLLAESEKPVPMRSIREACGIRTTTLCKLVHTLIESQQIKHSEQGYSLA